MSTAETIASALATRLALITTTNGYTTNLGGKVFRGRRRLDETMIPSVVLIEGNDRVTDESRSAPRPGGRNKQVKLAQRYTLEGHLECDADHPNDAAHDAIADLKTAIFSEMTLGGLVRDIKYIGRTISAREDGIEVVSGAIEIEIEYTEELGNP
jgi:hypothetical protein